MGRRMTHSHRCKTSQNAYFRIDVQKDVHDFAGTISWQHSLGTTDPTLAASRQATYAAFYKAQVIELRQTKADQAKLDAWALVDRVFEWLARYFRSMDDAVTSQLDGIAIIVRSSWSIEDARVAEMQHLGVTYSGHDDLAPKPIPAIDGLMCGGCSAFGSN